MVSVGVSAHSRTNIHCIEPDNVNGQYYRDVLLKQGLLPDIRDITDEYFIFQQDSAPAHRARDTVALLETETPDFIPPTLWPPNSPDLNPVDYKIWSVMLTHAREGLQISNMWCQWVAKSNCGGMGRNGSAHHWWISQTVAYSSSRMRSCQRGGVNLNINFNFPNV